MENREIVQTFVDVLNEGFKADPYAIRSLIQNRVPCSKDLADHPDILCAQDKQDFTFDVGMIGVLNGICKRITGNCIAVQYDENMKMLGFVLHGFQTTSEDAPPEYSREVLARLCEQAVVPCEKWDDRDSLSAQKNLVFIYQGLRAGVKYKLDISSLNVILVEFERPTPEQLKLIEELPKLQIDTIEKFRAIRPDDEVFDSPDLKWDDYHTSYMPTLGRLQSVKGEDWYE